MDTHVFVTINKLQVLKAVVRAVAVDVMNMLVRFKFSSEMLFHHVAMLSDLRFPRSDDVAVAIVHAHMRIRYRLACLVVPIALRGTIPTPAARCVIDGQHEVLIAVDADALNALGAVAEGHSTTRFPLTVVRTVARTSRLDMRGKTMKHLTADFASELKLHAVPPCEHYSMNARKWGK
jgi:hypothetical protein